MLDSDYNIEETITYGKMRGWSESSILKDIRLRLSEGQDVNQQVDGGATPLMSAALAAYRTIVQALLDAGANPLLQNTFKEDAITCAKLSKNKEIVKIINDAVARIDGGSVRASKPSLYYKPKPKTEAEYTFFPTKGFRTQHGTTQRDVGFFLNSKEVLKLDPINDVSLSKDGVLTIRLDEGKVLLNSNEWDSLTEAAFLSSSTRKKLVIHDISDIVREYLNP